MYWWAFFISNETSIKIEKITTTFKLSYRSEHNTNETSCLDEEGFHTRHPISFFFKFYALSQS